MKICKNPSFSSYIIVIKPNKECHCCGRTDLNILDLIKFLNTRYDNETEIKAIGKQNVINYINENGLDDINIVEKIQSLDNDVAYITINNDEIVLLKIIYEMKNISIIYQQI